MKKKRLRIPFQKSQDDLWTIHGTLSSERMALQLEGLKMVGKFRYFDRGQHATDIMRLVAADQYSKAPMSGADPLSVIEIPVAIFEVPA